MALKSFFFKAQGFVLRTFFSHRCTEIKSFLFQPFLGGGEFTNAVSGRIKLGKETLSTVDGHWDEKVNIKDKRTGVSCE